MNNERYVIVYRQGDGDAPISMRTYTLDAAKTRADDLNAWLAENHPNLRDRWSVHELSTEVTS